VIYRLLPAHWEDNYLIFEWNHVMLDEPAEKFGSATFYMLIDLHSSGKDWDWRRFLYIAE
jgi:hypothetical protein